MMQVSHMQIKFEGDAYFPKINFNEWEMIFKDPHENFSFETYLRK